MPDFLFLYGHFYIIWVVTFSSGFTAFLSPLFSSNPADLSYLIGLFTLQFVVTGIIWAKYAALKQSNEIKNNAIKIMQQKIEAAQLQHRNLQLTENHLKEVNATKDKFLAIISHDLRGPLNSITGLLQILIGYANCFSKEELQDFAKNMDKSVRNLLDLLENLLRWSQTQTGTIVYKPQHINLHKVAADTAGLLEVAAVNKNISISIDLDKELEVFADADMLSFILRNLIHNAIKFTYTGGKVLIHATNQEDEIKISVTDNGRGISQQEINKLFKIDSCYTTNGTAKEIGTGLGLILCNEFIEKNGGNICVESELYKGATFSFTLPLIKKEKFAWIAVTD